MKTLLKPILITAGIAVVATVAQAQSLTILYTSTEVGDPGLPNYDISSAVAPAGPLYGGGYMYWYNLLYIPTSGIDSFSVFFVSTAGVSDISATSYSHPATDWTGVLNTQSVVWTHSGGDTSTPVQFWLHSPYAPTWGYANSLGSGSWTDEGAFLANPTGINGDHGVVVPNTPIPDGGLTAALLGGALLGLQALRRKLFC